MNSLSTEAIVLKRVDFGEADRLVTFFTQKRGKVVALAKGVRRVTSRRAPNIEVLNRVKIFLHETRSLPILTEAESLESFVGVKNRLEKLSLSYQLIELIDRFLEEGQETRGTYDLLVNSLRALDENPVLEKCKVLVSAFKIKLLNLNGYLPELYNCALCRKELSPAGNFLSPTSGGLVGEECRNQVLLVKSVTTQGIKTIRFLEKESMERVVKLTLVEALVRETADLLNFYTEFFLERELSSLNFASQIEQVLGPTN